MTAEAPSLASVDLGPLLVRRDAPGLLRFVVQAALLCGTAVATLRLAGAGDPLAWAAVLPCGIALATFFPVEHETGHGTAFRTPWLNEAIVWIAAPLMLQTPTFHREFHFEHHRETQDRERDPEINNAPALLDDWPANLGVYALVVCGQPLMFGKLGFTAACALLPVAVWSRIFPFVRERLRRRTAWESRAVLAVLASGCAAGLFWVPGFGALLAAWPIAHVVLGFYLLPEHTGLGHSGSQLDRTRTVRATAVVRWFMWNMPLHAEHHLQPGVPFHAVPALHRALETQLVNVTAGYVAFHREALSRALGRNDRLT